ncbi:MAG: GTP pyrophosphokinase family protein [Oliverpabstia sp.]
MEPLEFAGNRMEEVENWETLMFLYDAALRQVSTKIDILNEEFAHVHKYNPIEHVKSRIKEPRSIVKKLKRQGREVTLENMLKYINDIAGVRIICSFTSDIYRIADMLAKQKDLTVLELTDYLVKPKASGYRSYHMLVTVPVYLSDSVVDTKVEIQIRTIAQDFWASLEHKIYYKFEGNAPDFISKELQSCAHIVAELDDKMLSLNEAIKQCPNE